MARRSRAKKAARDQSDAARPGTAEEEQAALAERQAAEEFAKPSTGKPSTVASSHRGIVESMPHCLSVQ